MTSADGHELQAVVEECDIPKRLQLSLELLKKEYAIVSLQKKLGIGSDLRHRKFCAEKHTGSG